RDARREAIRVLPTLRKGDGAASRIGGPDRSNFNAGVEFHRRVIAELVWAVLTGLALLGFVATAASIAQGMRMAGLVRREMRTSFGAFLPRAVIVLPVRGLDPGFEENLRAILSQSYPHFRILVMADNADDSAAVRALEIWRT